MGSDGSDRRGGYGGAVFSLSVIVMMLYLGFAAVQGEYGLLRLLEVEAREAELEAELARLAAERAALANKTRRLSTTHLDLELLDERARAVLGLARPDEIMIP